MLLSQRALKDTFFLIHFTVQSFEALTKVKKSVTYYLLFECPITGLFFFLRENRTLVDFQIFVESFEDVGDAAQVNGLQVGHVMTALAVGQGVHLGLAAGEHRVLEKSPANS